MSKATVDAKIAKLNKDIEGILNQTTPKLGNARGVNNLRAFINRMKGVKRGGSPTPR